MSTVPPEGPIDPASDPTGAVPPPEQPAYGAPASPPPYSAAPPPYGQPGYGQPAYGAPAAPLAPSDERLWATLAHVGGIIVGFIAPLVIWLVFKERSRFVDDQGKEALNFQILVTIAYIVGSITTVIFIGFLILFAAWILTIIFGIQGGIAANKGQAYRYPFNWRIVK